MLLALGDHLHALVVEDDHLHGVGGQQLERQHVPEHDLVNDGEGGPTLIKGDPVVDHPHRHPPYAAGVRLQLELCRDGGEVLREV